MPWTSFVAALWLFPLAAGIALLLRILFARPLAKLAAQPLPRVFPELPLRHSIPLQRHRPIARLNGLPNFGLAFFIANFAPLFVFMLLGPIGARGLFVTLDQTRQILSVNHGPDKTLSVYVDAKRRFYLNEQPIDREELERRLTEQLATRLSRTVYFEADGGSPFADTAYTIDVIQGLGAKVIWITPKMRAEIEESRNRLP